MDSPKTRGGPGDELFTLDGATSPQRSRWIWVVYALLFAVSIPWYLRDPTPTMWLGLPHWVVLSLVAVLGVALFTTFVAWRYWPDTEPARGQLGADRS